MTADEAYHALCAYTLSLGDPEFIHQHVVDAYTAQNANSQTKPIARTFALVGLYLHLEKGFSGKQVQRTHMALAKCERQWPSIPLPPDRGALTAADVLATPAGPARAEAIDRWCASVWQPFQGSRPIIAQLFKDLGPAKAS